MVMSAFPIVIPFQVKWNEMISIKRKIIMCVYFMFFYNWNCEFFLCTIVGYNFNIYLERLYVMFTLFGLII